MEAALSHNAFSWTLTHHNAITPITLPTTTAHGNYWTGLATASLQYDLDHHFHLDIQSMYVLGSDPEDFTIPAPFIALGTAGFRF